MQQNVYIPNIEIRMKRKSNVLHVFVILACTVIILKAMQHK